MAEPRNEMRPIPGFPDYYADVRGNIFSSRKNGTARRLIPNIDRDGYGRVSLRRDGKSHLRRVHHLILETFVGPRPPGGVSRHGVNGVSDNSPSNLSWGTILENNGADRRRDGTIPRGEKCGMSKLTARQVAEIRTLRGKHPTEKIGKMFGVSGRSIRAIYLGETWMPLPAPPTIQEKKE